MIGDMYDNGTPNPLVIKCPNCGGENITEYIGTGSVKYWCNVCGEEFSYTRVTGCAVSELCPNCGTPMSYDHIHGTRYCTSCGCMVKDNTGMSDKTEVTKEQHISAESPKYGWICPKCGKVYAPYVKECSDCNYLSSISTSGRINQTSSEETHIKGVATLMNTQENVLGFVRRAK